MTTIPREVAAALALCLAACSPEPAVAPDRKPMTEDNSGTLTSAPAPPQAPHVPATTRAATVSLTLNGLGALKIGDMVPAGSGWAESSGQIPGSCRTISSPDFLGVYAIVEDGKVRRITIGERSKLKLVEGIGTGASEAELRAAFPELREEPHKYVELPGKYLTAPNAADGNPAHRFEVGRDGKVSLVHIGTMPVLSYVEGCA